MKLRTTVLAMFFKWIRKAGNGAAAR